MSNKITSYYVPNKIANSYVANKRTETGEYMYDSAMQDIGMETQAAVQSLNKSYSNVINDAYTNYLNSKRSIMSSDLGQGYKEAYIEKQQEALQETAAQASLSAAETKQQLLQQQYESQAAVGKAFQTEVLNMEQVGTQLTNYMEYLKNVYGEAGTSYYEDVISGKGLTDLDAKVGLKAEDIYDVLYNAQPKGYSTEGGEAAMGWMDWLKTQIKTEKEQSWYDWYVGEGGYEQFQDAYGSGYSQLVNDELAEQARKKEYDAAYAKAEEEYKIKRHNIDTEIDKQKLPDLNNVIEWHDYGMFDFGKTASDKIQSVSNEVEQALSAYGISSDELSQITGYSNASEMLKALGDIIQDINTGFDWDEAVSRNKSKFTEDFINTYIKDPVTGWFPADTASEYKKMAINAFNALMNNIKQYAKNKKYKEQNVLDDFSFASYEDYYK